MQTNAAAQLEKEIRADLENFNSVTFPKIEEFVSEKAWIPLGYKSFANFTATLKGFRFGPPIVNLIESPWWRPTWSADKQRKENAAITKTKARQLEKEIRADLENFSSVTIPKIQEFVSEMAWIPLGYKSFADCFRTPGVS